MFPWSALDPSVVVGPPSYPFPVPVPGRSISMQPWPFFGNQNSGIIPNPSSTFVPFLTPNTLIEPQLTQHASPHMQPGSTCNISRKQDSKNQSSGESNSKKGEDFTDFATHLQLKMPASKSDQVLSFIYLSYERNKSLGNSCTKIQIIIIARHNRD